MASDHLVEEVMDGDWHDYYLHATPQSFQGVIYDVSEMQDQKRFCYLGKHCWILGYELENDQGYMFVLLKTLGLKTFGEGNMQAILLSLSQNVLFQLQLLFPKAASDNKTWIYKTSEIFVRK